jgi:hypothetical protein
MNSYDWALNTSLNFSLDSGHLTLAVGTLWQGTQLPGTLSYPFTTAYITILQNQSCCFNSEEVKRL